MSPAEVVFPVPGVGVFGRHGSDQPPTGVREHAFTEAGIGHKQHGVTEAGIFEQQQQHDEAGVRERAAGVEERAAGISSRLLLLPDGESCQPGSHLPSCEEEDRVQGSAQGRLRGRKEDLSVQDSAGLHGGGRGG